MLQEREFRHLIETSRFINSARREKELASLWAETSEGVDIYKMYFDKSFSKLIDFDTNLPIENFIDKSSSPLAKREFKAFQEMENLMRNNGESVIFWISPPHKDRSKDTKLTIWLSRNKTNSKEIIGRTFLLSLTTEEVLEKANKVSSYSTYPLRKFESPEVLRQSAILLTTNIDWVQSTKDIFGKKPQIIKIQNGEDLFEYKKGVEKARKYAEMLDSSTPTNLIYQSMLSQGFIGTKDISCPIVANLTASNLLIQKSYSAEGSHVVSCGKCGTRINRWIPKGYQCPSCGGTYEGC